MRFAAPLGDRGRRVQPARASRSRIGVDDLDTPQLGIDGALLEQAFDERDRRVDVGTAVEAEHLDDTLR